MVDHNSDGNSVNLKKISVPDRNDFLEQARYGLAIVRRQERKAAVLRYRFKQPPLKSGLDYQGCEQLIRLFGERLLSHVRSSDLVIRIGEDEFAVFLAGLEKNEDICPVAGKIFIEQEIPYLVSGVEVFAQSRLGIAYYPGDAEEVESLLHCAGVALERAFEEGSDYCHFDAAHDQPTLERLQLDSELHRALSRQEFEIHYQPRVSCHSGEITGVEALLRWKHPVRGMLLPADFLSSLESAGLIGSVFGWTLQTACQQVRSWLDSGFDIGGLSINVSSRLFSGRINMVDTVRAALEASRLPPSRLELEFSETLIRDREGFLKTLGALKQLGIRLSIDHFGAGHAGLDYLRRCAVDTLIIDRTLMHDLACEMNDFSLVRAVIALAHSLGLKVVANGVEQQCQLDFLLAHRCDEFQGFLFASPGNATETAAVLQSRRRLPAEQLLGSERKRTLLLVDDEENILSSMRRLFRRDGYQILTANGGAEGLALLAENEVDVILSDQRMPGMTGVEFLRQAKTLYPETVRIVLSGYTELQSISDAINEGAIYKFLTKPWDDDMLREQVREAFRQRELAQENRMLEHKLQAANNSLKEANLRLQRMIDDKEREVRVGESQLQILQEVLQTIPLPMIGFDTDDLVVFSNLRVNALDGCENVAIGTHAEDCLPLPLLKVLRGEDCENFEWPSGHRIWYVSSRSLDEFGDYRGKLIMFMTSACMKCSLGNPRAIEKKV